MRPGILILPLTLHLAQTARSADLYWNGGNISASPANGGTGNWNTANAWRTGSSSGPQATWLADTGGSDNAYLGGGAGTVTLGTNTDKDFIGTNLTASTTGYTIISKSSSRDLVFSGTLTLADNVALTLDMDNLSPTWGFGTISFASGSSLLIKGKASAENSNRLNLSTAGTITGGGITLEGAGSGPTGLVSTANGVILNTNILNHSTGSATMLGATSGSTLVYGGVVSGNASLQISAGQNGGAGIVTLANQNTYGGGTYLNTANDGVLRMGVANALPIGTTVHFSQSAGGGSTAGTNGTIDLQGHDTAVGALDGSGRGVANTGGAATLTIGKAAGSNTFSGVIGIPSNLANLTGANHQISLVKTGGSTQILTGANTYTGATDVNSGTLAVDGSLANTTVTVASGARLGGAGTIGTGSASVVIQSGGTYSPGNSPGSQTINGSLTFQSGSIFEWDLNASNDDPGEGTVNSGTFDQVTVNGSVSGAAVFRILLGSNSFSSPFWDTEKKWTGIFAGGGAPANLASVFPTFGGDVAADGKVAGQGQFSFNNSFTLTWTAIPELSNILIGGLMGLGMMRRGRRA